MRQAAGLSDLLISSLTMNFSSSILPWRYVLCAHFLYYLTYICSVSPLPPKDSNLHPSIHFLKCLSCLGSHGSLSQWNEGKRWDTAWIAHQSITVELLMVYWVGIYSMTAAWKSCISITMPSTAAWLTNPVSNQRTHLQATFPSQFQVLHDNTISIRIQMWPKVIFTYFHM